jgi:phospho-N-acetylmuramoyl-pentapeptide-transferase
MLLTPILTHYLYKYKMWRKKPGKSVSMTGSADVYNSLRSREREVSTPRMGGIIIWASSTLTIILFSAIAFFHPTLTTQKLSFLSREQTWLPLFTLISGSLIGLIDDYFDVSGRVDNLAGGLSLKKRLFVVFLIGLVGAWWFFFKLDVSMINIPFAGFWDLGVFFIPFFIAVMLAVYASGVIDGLDGLAGGTFASVFVAYAGIAFFQHQVDLAALCAVIFGGILAFLWFNIPPARFYMGETGTMGLTATLAVVAFLTHTVLLLPIIAFPLFITVVANILQVFSKKVFGRKIFLVAPIHHHFEAIGWPAYKVTMRYWIISMVSAILGMILAVIN